METGMITEIANSDLWGTKDAQPVPARKDSSAADNMVFSRQFEPNGPVLKRDGGVLLPPPQGNFVRAHTPQLEGKLAQTQGSVLADIFSIAALIHEVMVEMKRNSSSRKYEAFQAEVRALEAGADKLEKAAMKELGAALATGILSVAGGAIGVRASWKSSSMLKSPAKMPDTPTPVRPDIARSAQPDIPKPVHPAIARIKAQSQPPLEGPNGPVPQKPNTANGNKPGKKPEEAQKDASQQRKDGPDANAKQEIDPAVYTKAQNLSNNAMILSQLISAVGNLAGSPLTYAANMDRAAKERDDADASRERAKGESIADFTRNIDEGMKSLRDTLNQFLASRERTHREIYS